MDLSLNAGRDQARFQQFGFRKGIECGHRDGSHRIDSFYSPSRKRQPAKKTFFVPKICWPSRHGLIKGNGSKSDNSRISQFDSCKHINPATSETSPWSATRRPAKRC